MVIKERKEKPAVYNTCSSSSSNSSDFEEQEVKK